MTGRQRGVAAREALREGGVEAREPGRVVEVGGHQAGQSELQRRGHKRRATGRPGSIKAEPAGKGGILAAGGWQDVAQRRQILATSLASKRRSVSVIGSMITPRCCSGL